MAATEAAAVAATVVVVVAAEAEEVSEVAEAVQRGPMEVIAEEDLVTTNEEDSKQISIPQIWLKLAKYHMSPTIRLFVKLA